MDWTTQPTERGYYWVCGLADNLQVVWLDPLKNGDLNLWRIANTVPRLVMTRYNQALRFCGPLLPQEGCEGHGRTLQASDRAIDELDTHLTRRATWANRPLTLGAQQVADLNTLLNYLLRARTLYEGQRHPNHIEATIRLSTFLIEQETQGDAT